MNKENKYGVWCIEDRAWCHGTIGDREYAESELPHWVSGERAEVDPKHFHYEVREKPEDYHPTSEQLKEAREARKQGGYEE